MYPARNGASRGWRTNGIIALVTAAVLTFAGPIGAHAEEAPSSPQAIQEAGTPVTLSPSQIRDIEANVAATNQSKRTFNALSASKNGASEQSIADYATVLSSQGWLVVGATTSPSLAAQKIATAAKASCKGFSGYHGYYVPWGAQYGINSCNTAKIIASAGLGTAGAAGVAAVLTVIGATGVGLPISVIAAAVIGFGAAALITCQAFSSNGAIWLNIGGLAPSISCWGQ